MEEMESFENNSLETKEIDCQYREEIDGIEDVDDCPEREVKTLNEERSATEISTDTHLKTDSGEEFDKIANNSLEIEEIDDFQNEEWSSMEISIDSSGKSSTGAYCI